MSTLPRVASSHAHLTQRHVRAQSHAHASKWQIAHGGEWREHEFAVPVQLAALSSHLTRRVLRVGIGEGKVVIPFAELLLHLLRKEILLRAHCAWFACFGNVVRGTAEAGEAIGTRVITCLERTRVAYRHGFSGEIFRDVVVELTRVTKPTLLALSNGTAQLRHRRLFRD
jgi:hypothetical protein